MNPEHGGEAMERDEMVQMLEEAGHPDEAAMIARVTPEDEARFDEWLSDPVNERRWEDALADARR